MANKRKFKKAVKAACGNIAGECLIARNLIPGIDGEKMEQAVVAVADLQYVTLANASFSFDRSRRSYADGHTYKVDRDKYFRKGFNKLVADFNKGIEDVIAMMNSALPAKKVEE